MGASRRNKTSFVDEQYRAMQGDEAAALDHPLYRYLLPYAVGRVNVAVSMLSGKRLGRLLELGCGPAGLGSRILEQCEKYVGVDISDYQLSQAPEDFRRDPRVTLCQADLDEKLELADGAFDSVVSLSTIEYVADPHRFLDDIVRVLKPGGTLLIHTMNLAFLPRRMQLFFGKLPTYNTAAGWQGGVLHEFTYPSMKRLLGDHGFTVTGSQCAGLAPKLRMAWPNLLASDMLFACRRSGSQPTEPPR